MVPKAIALLDRCKRESYVDPNKVLPVVASVATEVAGGEGAAGSRMMDILALADFPDDLDRLREWQRRRDADEERARVADTLLEEPQGRLRHGPPFLNRNQTPKST
jgi:hypothetical protein